MSKKHRCLVCDDEPVARRILKNYIEKTPFLTFAGECENGLEAITFLQNGPVDLLFLDINMPVLDGLSFLRALKKRPKTILTTAYSEHGLEAFDLEVVDYLVKPVPFERFLRAIARATEAENKPEKTPETLSEPAENEHLVVRFGRLLHRIQVSDVLFLESQGNAVKIVTSTQVLRTYQTLSTLEKQLPAEDFVRTHRSFLVNRRQVSTLDGLTIVFHEEHRVPISEPIRAEVLLKLGFGEG